MQICPCILCVCVQYSMTFKTLEVYLKLHLKPVGVLDGYLL